MNKCSKTLNCKKDARKKSKKKNISKEKKEHIEGRISMLLRNKTKN